MLLTFEPFLEMWGKMTESPRPYQGSLPAEVCDPREVWGPLRNRRKTQPVPRTGFWSVAHS